MALTKTVLTGRFPFADDVVPAYAVARFTPSGFDTEGSDVIFPDAVEVELADGYIPAAFSLWTTTAGTRDRIYRVTVIETRADENGGMPREKAIDYPPIAVPAVGPVTIASLLAVELPAYTAPDVLAMAIAAQVAAETAADRAEAVGTFGDRASLALWAASNTPVDQRSYVAGGLHYVGSTGSTVIPDILGMDPVGEWVAGHFGLDLTGATNETAALANVPSGATIDMQGGLITVDAIPADWRGYNGSWLVSSVKHNMRVDAATPFGGQIATVASYPFTFWPGGAWYDVENDLLYAAQVVSHGHLTADGSRVDLLTSRDHGATFKRMTIFSDATDRQVRAAAIGLMNGGRFGGIVSTGDTTRKQWFVKKDTGGAWTATYLSGITVDHFVHGDLLAGPSGDPDDWMVATYAGTAAAKYIRTTDNGTTWADVVIRDNAGLPGTLPSPSEPLILYAPGVGFACFVRVETTPASEQNMFVCTSADAITWSAWADTGVPLGSNPVYGVYDGGKFELILSYRQGFAGTDFANTIQSITIDPAALIADPTHVAGLPCNDVAALAARGIGYFNGVRLPRLAGSTDAVWAFFGKANESDNSLTRGASADMVRLSRLPIAPVIAHPSKQLIANPGFNLKRRGTSFASFTVDTPFADRWVARPSGSTMSVTLSDMTEAQRNIFPMWGSVANIDATANDFSGFAQFFMGQDAQSTLRAIDTTGKLTARIYGAGNLPAQLIVQVLVNGTGVSLSDTAFPIPPTCAAGGWVTEVEFDVDNIAVLPSAATSVTISFNTGDASQIWDSVDLFAAPVWAGENPPMDDGIRSDAPDNTYLRVWEGNDNRFMLGSAVSTTGGWFFRADDAMKSTPAVSYSALADIVIETGLTERTLSGLTLTASSLWSGGYQLRGVTTGLTLGQAIQLKITNLGGWLRVDTGY